MASFTPTRWLNYVADLLAAPFTRANSIDAYGENGYRALGAATVLVSILFVSSQRFSDFAASPAPPVKVIFSLVTNQLHLPPELSILALPLAIWAVGLTSQSVRRKVGEWFADLLFWILDRMVHAGEFCIEHRWASVLIVMFLVAALVAGTNYYVSALSRTQDLKRDYELWFSAVERLLLESPLTQPETARYRDAELNWHKDFGSLLPKANSGLNLHEFCAMLFDGTSDQQWSTTIRQRLKDIETVVSRGKNAVTLAPDSTHASHVQALLEISRAKLLVRLAKSDRDAQLLLVAYQVFSSVSTSGLYKSAVRNGLGTVYANALSAHLDWSKDTSSQPQSALVTICRLPYDCVVRAHDAYIEAAIGSPRCSFESRRQINNEADLHTRLAFNYESVLRGVSPSQVEPWLSTKTAVRGRLHQDIDELDSCSSAEPRLTIILITTAQCYAALVKLLAEDKVSYSSEAASAGHYLRMAYTFERKNYTSWNLEYFCAVLSPKSDRTGFVQELRTPPGPVTVPLQEVLERTCQSKH